MRVAQLIIATLCCVVPAMSADAADVNFVTAFMSDYNDHKRQYISYFATAATYPKDVSALALQAVTYTDDSYTTLLDDAKINVQSIVSFATNLPWYPRIAEHLQNAPNGANGETKNKSASGESLRVSTSQHKGGCDSKSMAQKGLALGAFVLMLL